MPLRGVANIAQGDKLMTIRCGNAELDSESRPVVPVSLLKHCAQQSTQLTQNEFVIITSTIYKLYSVV